MAMLIAMDDYGLLLCQWMVPDQSADVFRLPPRASQDERPSKMAQRNSLSSVFTLDWKQCAVLLKFK
ncbi:hypothetical protein C0J52_22047, partial [Blattella germanica]